MTLRVVSVDSRDCGFPLCPEEAELGTAWCHRHRHQAALEHAAHTAGRVRGNATVADATVADAIGLAPATSRPAGSSALTLDNLERLHRLYRNGASINELAAAIWQRAGFKNAASCAERIRQQFKALGLPVRTRAEASKLAREKRAA